MGTIGATAAGVGAVVTETIATIWNVCDAIGTAYDTAKLGIEAYKKLDEIKDILSLVKQAKAELENTLKNMTPSSNDGNRNGGAGENKSLYACKTMPSR
ncbi:hypothetical protein ACTR8L_003782 [Escherichia coli]